jgi:WD40 repeat protein
MQPYPLDILALLFSPDGKFLVSAGGGDIMLWNLETGDRVASWRHLGPLNPISFNQTDELLGVDDMIWNVKEGDLFLDLAGGTFRGFNADGTVALVSGGEAGIGLIDASTGEVLPSPQIGGRVLDAAFNPGSTLLAVIVEDSDGWNNRLEVWGVHREDVE